MDKAMKNRKLLKTIQNKVLIYIPLMLFALLMMGPFLWLLSVSLMPGKNVFAFPPAIFPTFIDFKNYVDVWQYMDFLKYIWNTVIITFFGVVFSILLCSLTAYPLAIFKFKGKNIIFVALIATMIIPAAAGLVVNYLTINKLGLINTFTGVVLPGLVTVFNVFLFRQAFMGIPSDIRDSGKMDGASELRIWWQLMMPMIKPAIAVVALFEFMASWNSFLWPIIVLNTDKYPLASALSFLNGQFSYNFGWIAAGTVISVLPIIIVFLLTQKYFMEGISGAIKG
ncbi:carbohydrate ABC transporter permease [Solibacillus sp. MA9]|uniref:Carbohydrate ABC transporter permease n=2 Tax=Solibacillus palustris TaxID=2908203 RepID=A0ABS9UH28_9BACL|nr:carbohydrate ABC transporter permease [Solibacillus sp. MA9]MCH7323394.1 carbohydrate ABC transporter permease [Solibacillus sp. MA9]